MDSTPSFIYKVDFLCSLLSYVWMSPARICTQIKTPMQQNQKWGVDSAVCLCMCAFYTSSWAVALKGSMKYLSLGRSWDVVPHGNVLACSSIYNEYNDDNSPAFYCTLNSCQVCSCFPQHFSSNKTCVLDISGMLKRLKLANTMQLSNHLKQWLIC
jgi:hypothetical protein